MHNTTKKGWVEAVERLCPCSSETTWEEDNAELLENMGSPCFPQLFNQGGPERSKLNMDKAGNIDGS